ncbi:MAG: ATP-binding cassette domain-containing protein [Bacillus subtilis]|nr:ATP-binding cassette domain-containing protein [Bacillus subtilis]
MLEIKDLVVDYGIIRAIKGIDLNVEEGTIVAILGANGAGKTSTIRDDQRRCQSRNAERFVFDGENITDVEPYKLAAKGIIQSPEGRLILRGLTVEENLMVGAYSAQSRSPAAVTDETGETKTRPRPRLAIAQRKRSPKSSSCFPVLKERRKQQASTLSGGEQQMLAIGRALMASAEAALARRTVARPGAADRRRKSSGSIQKIKAAGTTILIVEQNAFQTLKIADYVYVLELGKVKTQGPASVDASQTTMLVKAYLGG